MIVWTIKSAIDTPVYDDRSFMKSYQDVDNNYNKMVISNAKFNARYETKITINNRTVTMDFSDIQYGQRSLEKKSKNQNILRVGENSISILIKDIQQNKMVADANISIQLTRAIEDMYDINLYKFRFVQGSYQADAKIRIEGNWNITGHISIGDDIGYLYIKTNTKR
jgi:hypothetical protein